jgi:hypothetical protein
MMVKRMLRLFWVAAVASLLPAGAFADEIVHFTNGAEMAVKSHVVEQDMVKLDLGGSSFIAFPMSMVDKIMNAGRDVFLNPTFHPANQAVAGAPGAPGAPGYSGAPGAAPAAVADTAIQGGGGAGGFNRQPNAKGGAGVMLGEVADTIPAMRADANVEQPITAKRRAYNPAFPAVPGGMPQVITPPMAPKTPSRMTLATPPPAPPPPAPAPPAEGTPESAPQGNPDSDDPPNTP